MTSRHAHRRSSHRSTARTTAHPARETITPKMPTPTGAGRTRRVVSFDVECPSQHSWTTCTLRAPGYLTAVPGILGTVRRVRTAARSSPWSVPEPSWDLARSTLAFTERSYCALVWAWSLVALGACAVEPRVSFEAATNNVPIP